MNNNYQKLIQYRNAYRRLSQISWALNNAETRFPMGTPQNEEQLISLYESMIPDVKDVLKELEDKNK